MMLKSLMKNPILAVGILFFVLFMYQLRDQGFFAQRANSMIPTSCKAVKVRLDKYMHESWEIDCSGNNLQVYAPVDKKLAQQKFEDLNILRQNLYKALANTYISLSRYAPSDSLERTMIISVSLEHPQMQLNSVSEGKHVFNLKNMKNFKRISQHIKSTIQVQEVVK
jgi:hypothetical protein